MDNDLSISTFIISSPEHTTNSERRQCCHINSHGMLTTVILVQRLTQYQMVSILQSLTVHLAVNNGLGRRASLLTRQNYEGAAKVGCIKQNPYLS